jgi:DNA-directed RNA polymerase specialized sigma24 family protein
LLARKRRTVPLDLDDQDGQAALEPSDPGPQTDQLAENAQDLERLQSAMSSLASDERLVLNLRFRQALTFEEIARLMKLANSDQAFRKVNAALKKLGQIMAS